MDAPVVGSSDRKGPYLTANAVVMATLTPTPTPTPTPVLPGDMTNDGQFDMKDLLLVQEYFVNKETEINEEICDMNNDGITDLRDLIRMYKLLVKE